MPHPLRLSLERARTPPDSPAALCHSPPFFARGAPGTLRPARARAPTRCVAWRRLLMLGDFVLVALLADFLSLYAEAVKEGGLEANVSLNGAEMA